MSTEINYTQAHRDDLMVLMIRRTEQETAVMEALAVMYSPITRSRIAATLNAIGVLNDNGQTFAGEDIKPIIGVLKRKGLLVWDGTKAACCGALVELLTRRMVEEGRFETMARAVEDIDRIRMHTATWGVGRHGDSLLAFRIALYRNDAERAFQILDAMKARYLDSALRPYHQICCNPFDAKWFDGLDPILQAEAMGEILTEMSDRLEPIDEYLDLADSILAACPSEAVAPLRFICAKMRLLQGQWAKACEIASGLDSLHGNMAAAWMDFLAGNNERAITGFEETVKLIRRERRKRNVYIPGLPGIAFVLALVKDGRSKALARAAQLVKFARMDSGNNDHCAWAILEYVVDFRAGEPDSELPDGFEVWGATDQGSPISIMLQEALTYWQGEKRNVLAPLRGLHRDAAAGGYRWLAAESGELLSRVDSKSAGLGKTSAEFRAETGTVSMFDAIVRQEPWQRALEAMTRIGETTQSAEQPKRTERLIWRIEMNDDMGVGRIQPILQKSTQKGWTRGRNVAIKRLYQEHGSLEYVTDHDRRICGSIEVEYDDGGYRHYGQREIYAFDQGRALIALVGHPLVFWDQGDTQIEVVASRPELQVIRQEKLLHVNLTPSMTDSYGQELDFVAIQESPTRLAVITFSPEHRRIAGIVGPDGIDVPNRGEAELLKAIAAASSSVTVQSDIGVGDTHEQVENVEPCSTPHLQLYPHGDGLKAAVLIRPFGIQGPYYPAKSGGQTVLAEVEGKRLQTTRDFVAETRGIEDMREACGALGMFDNLGGEYFSTDIETCLQLLLELGLFGDRVIVEWPQGEKFRIEQNVSASQFRMNIKKSKDWFAATGTLQIDESRVLDMRELLALVEQSSGKFIPLGEGKFLALTVEFRKRLEELRTFGDPSGKGVRMHPLTAALLEEIANEVGSCKTDKHWKEHLRKLSEARDLKPTVPSTFQGELRDYQVTGFEWMVRLAHWGVGACLADDMGLGKTIQALAVILTRAADGPTLVIAPTSVGANWVREAARFAPTLRVKRFGTGDRRDTVESAGPYDLIVCTYGLLAQEGELLAERSWGTIVLDEAQAIKNMATKRSKAAMGLVGDFKLLTTGTPIENHLGELWNQFRFINPGLLGSIKSFNDRFAVAIERDRDKDVGRKLRKLIHPFILRRTKSQVLDELPPRTEIRLQVELSEAEAAMYESLRRDAVEKLSASGAEAGKQRFEIFAEIMKLRRMCCNPRLVAPKTSIAGSKLEVFGQVLEELLDNRHKALVFSQFVAHLSIIREYLDANNVTYQYLDGSTTVKQRQKRIDAFQAGQGDVFLISLRAGGLGLNLTAADYVIHMDPWWNPAVEDQASDRAHRIGQQRPVTVYRLVTTGTIEEKIVELHHRKRHLADSLLEGADMAGKLSADDLLRLLQDG
jgi:superfamily II DNA or RNA helicase